MHIKKGTGYLSKEFVNISAKALTEYWLQLCNVTSTAMVQDLERYKYGIRCLQMS